LQTETNCTEYYSGLTLRAFGVRRDVRAVEGARLESVYTFARIEGSNPSLSGKFIVAGIGSSAALDCEPRQVRKEATVAVDAGD
jgi:hypothetical protein